MSSRCLASLPMEIQTMIFKEVVSFPDTRDRYIVYKKLTDGLRCLRVCKTWKNILRPLLLGIFPIYAFIGKGLETLSYDAIRYRISKREAMVAKFGSREEMREDVALEFDMLINGVDDDLRLAGIRGFVSCMELIIENLPTVSVFPSTSSILLEMVKFNQPRALKLLLDQDSILKKIDEPDDSGATPLAIAARSRLYENMGILMDYGANINIIPRLLTFGSKYQYDELSPGGRLLTFATINGDAKMLDLLLRRGIKPEMEENHGGDYHLDIAFSENRIDLAEKLLHHGANIKPGPDRGLRRLNRAIRSCSLESVKKLIDLGADYTTIECNGRLSADYIDDTLKYGNQIPDALSTAIVHRRQDVFDLLLRYGATLKPIHLSNCAWRDLSMAVQILDVIGTENAGEALSLASKFDYKDFIKLFFEFGVRS